MSLTQKLRHEIRALASAMLFFGCWIAVLVFVKQLLLAEYQIQFHGMLGALVGALILGKVVLVAEHVSLGDWVRAQPAWVDVILRTALYGLGVVVVLLLEKSFEGRKEYGDLGASLRGVLQHAEIHHVWANTICVTAALLTWNALAVIRRNLGDREMLGIFLSPLPPAPGVAPPEDRDRRTSRATDQSSEAEERTTK